MSTMEVPSMKFHQSFGVDDNICNYTRVTLFSTNSALSNDQSENESPSTVLLVTWLIWKNFLPLVLPVVFIFVIKFLWDTSIASTRDAACSLPLPPGSLGLPFIGETLAFAFSPFKFFSHRFKTYGNIYKTHILGNPTIRVIGAENVKKILMNENNFVHAHWPRSARMILGEGSLSSAIGTLHYGRKKTILRAFSSQALETYAHVIHETIHKYVQKWCERKQVLGYVEFRRLNFEISCRILLGMDISEKEMSEMMTTYEELQDNLFSAPIYFPGTGFYKGMKARQKLLSKFDYYIQQKETQGSASGFTDVLSYIMRENRSDKMSTAEAKDACLELLFAGHGSTSSAAATLVLNLHNHPETITDIISELAQYNLLESMDHHVPLQTMNKLNFTKNVVKEALRITPPIGGGFRKAIRTFEVDGFQIPSGWTVSYSIRESHHSTGNGSTTNSYDFDPSRWQPSKQEGEQTTYFPFGGGKRACAGRELALIVLRTLAIELSRSCAWKLLNGKPEIQMMPVPHPKDLLPMEFTGLVDCRIRSRTI